jgi:hypothetical protein
MQVDLRDLCKKYVAAVHTELGQCNEALREVLGCDGAAADVDDSSDQSSQRQRFFSKLHGPNTAADYATRVARCLRLLLGLAHDADFAAQLRSQSDKELLPDHLKNPLFELAECVDGDDDEVSLLALHKVFVSLVETDTGLVGTYADYPTCTFIVSELCSANGLMVASAAAEKSLSALKFFLRGCLLIQSAQELERRKEEGITIRHFRELECLDRTVQQGRGIRAGNTNMLSVLSRMAKAINTFTLAKQPKVVFPRPTSPRMCSVNNKQLGTQVVSEVVTDLKVSIKRKLKQLLLGFKVGSSTRKLDATNEDAPGWAFGRDRDLDSKTLLNHAKGTTRKRFWVWDERKELYVVKSGDAAVYLRSCTGLENDISVLFHLLSGAGARGSDFEYQTFRNGGDIGQRRNTTILNTGLGDAVLQFAVPIRKTSLLHGKAEGVVRFIDLRSAKYAIQYYLLVRPFASYLRRHIRETKTVSTESIRRLGGLDRWDRFLFVKASSERLRNAVEAAFRVRSRGIKFNEVRHFSVAVHRHFITPQELRVQQEYPVHQGFGHARSTDLGYGTGAFASNSGECDASAVLRCSRLWWRIIGATGKPARGRRVNKETESETDSESYWSERSSSDREHHRSQDNSDDDDDDDDDEMDSNPKNRHQPTRRLGADGQVCIRVLGIFA